MSKALEILEDIETYLLKNQDKVKGDIGDLHYKINQNKNREKWESVDREGYDKYFDKQNNKREQGELRNQIRQLYQLQQRTDKINNGPDDEEATAKSIKRHKKKMNKNEALELVEAIITETSKADLVDKYVPSMKAERRNLDKRVKKDKVLAKGLKSSASLSADMEKLAQSNLDKAEDKVQATLDSPNIGDYIEAVKDRKAAEKEKQEWVKDKNDTLAQEKEVNKEAKALNDKRNKINKKVATLKGMSDMATNKSFEALELAEAIINEVSIKKWKEAAANVLPKRMEDAEAAKASVEKGWEEYDKAARKHPEEEPALYRLAQANDEAAQKAEDKADHAYAVTRLRSNAKSANTAIKAAKKVQDKREDEFGRNPEKRTLLRSGKANQLVSADPVKSRADEALQLAEAIINEVSDEWKKRAQQKAGSNVKSARDNFTNKLTALEKGDMGVTKDDVNKAFSNLQKQVGRASKLDNAIIKHDLAKMQGKIKPASNSTNEALQLAEAIVAAASPDDDYYNQKSIRRNAEKEAKKHGYNAKQYEKKSIKAEEDGRERRAEYLYDKANSEWDKETAQQQRAADAHRKVEDLRFRRRGKGMDEAFEIAEAIIDVISEGDNLRNVVKRARRAGKIDNTKDSDLEKRAMRVPADNDYYEDKEGKNVYDLHGKGVSKTDFGAYLNDQRHYNKGRDKEELWNKRRNDEVRGYSQATAKGIKKHNKTNEALELAEAIINEVSDELKKRAQQKAEDNIRDAKIDRENKIADLKFGNMGVTKEDVKKAELDVQKQVGRAARLDNAIIKHDLAKMQGKIKPVSNKTNEALQLAEAICDFADNLFELDYEQKQDISPNKIKKTKTDKNGEKVEVVSVADELFPYEGTAKQQFNQKIIAKINDMIEGTGSLEDLIQFVRAGAKVKKTVNEGYEAAEEILEEVINVVDKYYQDKIGKAKNNVKTWSKFEKHSDKLFKRANKERANTFDEPWNGDEDVVQNSLKGTYMKKQAKKNLEDLEQKYAQVKSNRESDSKK